MANNFMRASGDMGKSNRGLPTKKLRGVDLGWRSFLFVGDKTNPVSWLLPVCDLTNEQNTRQHIERSIDHWSEIALHIPKRLHQQLYYQLEGAAQSFGIAVPSASEQTMSEAEMDLWQEANSFGERMLALAELDSLYS
jgi:hypothetical protein